MRVSVNVKQLSKPKAAPVNAEYELDAAPRDLKELINALVRKNVREYNERVKKGDSPEPLGEDEISRRALMGRIAFGINYSGTFADEEKSVKTALSAFEDGLFRVFMGDIELTALSDAVSLSETFTFIRLTMLTGRLW